MNHDELNRILGSGLRDGTEEIDEIDAYYRFLLDPEQLHVSGDFVYDLSEDGSATIITLADQSMQHVTIPDTLDGHRVVSIGEYAFAKCRALKSVIISASITYFSENALVGCQFETAGHVGSGCDYQFSWTHSIPDNAFAQLKQLHRVELPAGIMDIGSGAFYGCALPQIDLPEGIISIGAGAFKDCGLRGRLILPRSLLSIGENAFSGCLGITDVVFHEGLYRIGVGAFSNMQLSESHFYGSNMFWTQMFLNPEIRSLPNAARFFINDVEAGHQRIRIPNGCTQWSSAVTAVIESAGPVGSGCDFEFAWTEEIPENAFFEARNLKKVILPESIRRIGERAFDGCSNLEEIEIPDGVRVIPKMCFFECIHLRRVRLPQHLTCIEERAFSACENLQCITFPDSLERIDHLAFNGCRSIKGLELPERTTAISTTAFHGTMNLKCLTCWIREPESNLNSTLIDRLEYLYAPVLHPKYLSNSPVALREYALRSACGMEYDPEVARVYEDIASNIKRRSQSLCREMNRCPELRAMVERYTTERYSKIDTNTHPDEIKDIVPALQTFAENLEKGVEYSQEIYDAYIQKLCRVQIAGRLSQAMLGSIELTRLVAKYRKLNDRFKRQLCERFGDEIITRPIKGGKFQA